MVCKSASGNSAKALDLDAGTLTISTARATVHGIAYEGAPKSQAGKVLKAHRTAQKAALVKLGPAWQRRDLVFGSETGGYLSAGNILRVYKRLILAAEVKRIRFHDLRHTAATLMLASGVPVKVVSEMLGHANVTITLNLYAHVLPGMSKEASATLGRLLAGGA